MEVMVAVVKGVVMVVVVTVEARVVVVMVVAGAVVAMGAETEAVAKAQRKSRDQEQVRSLLRRAHPVALIWCASR